MKINLLIFFLIFLSSPVFAQQEEEDGEIPFDGYTEVLPKNDSIGGVPVYSADSLLQKGVITDIPLKERNLSTDIKDKYKGEDFDYSANKPKTSFLEKLKKKLRRLLDRLFSDTDFNKISKYEHNIIRLIGIIVLGILLYFVIKYLMRKDGNWFYGKKNQKINIPSNDIVENIHEINFREMISKAENQQDYRLAIRYHFLRMLKTLTDKNLIDWNPEKTNRDYISEISASELKEQFKDASRIFDYVWYGEFSINETEYKTYKDKFN